MSAGTVQRMEIAQASQGAQDSVPFLEDTTGQTFVFGALLIEGASEGYVRAAAGGADEKIVGMAMNAATGTKGGVILVIPIIPGVTRLRVSACHGADGSGAADSITAQADVLNAVSCILVSGCYVADITAVGDNAAHILKIMKIEGTAGEKHGRYICTLKSLNSVWTA